MMNANVIKKYVNLQIEHDKLESQESQESVNDLNNIKLELRMAKLELKTEEFQICRYLIQKHLRDTLAWDIRNKEYSDVTVKPQVYSTLNSLTLEIHSLKSNINDIDSLDDIEDSLFPSVDRYFALKNYHDHLEAAIEYEKSRDVNVSNEQMSILFDLNMELRLLKLNISESDLSLETDMFNKSVDEIVPHMENLRISKGDKGLSSKKVGRKHVYNDNTPSYKSHAKSDKSKKRTRG